MAQSVRERTSELAVLKTLGFSDRAILALVLAESLFIAVLGGGLGLALAWLIVQQRRSDRRPAAGRSCCRRATCGSASALMVAMGAAGRACCRRWPRCA